MNRYFTKAKERRDKIMFNSIMATGLLVQDLARCTAFYRDILKLEVQDSDSTSTSFRVENVYFFLLEATTAAKMIGDASLERKTVGGAQVLLAAGVENVDTAYAELKARGVTMLNPPTDQPWGLRTAYFSDPEGNYWEINQPIDSKTAE
jgi:lactoylglutathione lyase